MGRAPATIGRYVIERELGRGGMGVVYAALDPELGRRVAIKQLLSERAAASSGARFALEGEAAARLRHPGIATVHEAGLAPDGPFLVQDLVEGESLQARLARAGPLPPEEAARLGVQLAEALAHAHGRGILHRDLKPANALLTLEGRVVLTDFGLARDLADERERLTRTGEMLGTPAYMAPEQADGQAAAYDPRTDVYGLAATLYALLTARPPFEGPALQLVHAVLLRDPAPPSERVGRVPPALDTIVLKGMAKEPGDRYPSAEALAADLTRFLAGEPPLGQAPPRRGRRARAVALALVALGVLLAAVALRAARARPERELPEWTRELTALAADVRGDPTASAKAERLARLLEQVGDLPEEQRAALDLAEPRRAQRLALAARALEAALRQRDGLRLAALLDWEHEHAPAADEARRGRARRARAELRRELARSGVLRDPGDGNKLHVRSVCWAGPRELWVSAATPDEERGTLRVLRLPEVSRLGLRDEQRDERLRGFDSMADEQVDRPNATSWGLASAGGRVVAVLRGGLAIFEAGSRVGAVPLSSPARHLALSPSGRWAAAVVGSPDESLLVVDLDAGGRDAVVARAPLAAQTDALAFRGEEEVVRAAQRPGSAEGEVHAGEVFVALHRRGDLEQVWVSPPQREGQRPRALACTPAGELLIGTLAGEVRRLRLGVAGGSDPSAGERLLAPGATGAVRHLELAPDGRLFVARSARDELAGTVRWELCGVAPALAATIDVASEMAVAPGEPTLQRFAVSPDGQWLALLFDDGTVRTWGTPP